MTLHKTQKCDWCNGTGRIKLIGYGYKKCFNCNGEGEHIPYRESSKKVSGRKNYWLFGNKHWKKREGKEENDCV